MFTLYGFDPKAMTDDQLFNNQLELTRRSILSVRFGKVDMTNYLQMMIQAIEMERRERIFNDRIGSVMLSSSPVVVETDPDLCEQHVQQNEIIQAKSQQDKPIRRPVRSTRPIAPKKDGEK